MKPENIILIRHGESIGNADKRVYTHTPDYAVTLTEKGKTQAFDAGFKISQYLTPARLRTDTPVQFYVSPFFRTRQTYQQVSRFFPKHVYYEDPRLREQEWNTKLADTNDKEPSDRDSYGHFYYRLSGGESCADVYDRVSDFMNTMHRDFEKKHFPKNAILVTHGMTLRVFLMRWFHWSVEQFEILANPKNCEYHIIHLGKNGKYELITTPRKYPSHNHPYQFDWSKS